MSSHILKKLNKELIPSQYFFHPDWIVLGVNNVCNLHCKMCDVGTKNTETIFSQNLVGTHPINMPKELIKRIIQEVHLYYPKTKLGYAFTEPLVYPHLIESLNYAALHNIFTAITTNALTLKQKAEDLVNSGIGEINISLDGPLEIHNHIRGHIRSFQKAIEGIDKILELNDQIAISIFCVITQWNIGHLKSFLDYFKSYPIKEIGFMHTNFTTNKIAKHHNTIWGNKYFASHSNVEEISFEQYNLDVLWREIEIIKNENYNFKVSFSPEIGSKEMLHTFYEKPNQFFGKRCNDIFSNIMIKSDGSVIPAHGRCYNINLGNIYDQSLKDIWESKTLKEIRTDLNKSGGLFPACSRCCSAF